MLRLWLPLLALIFCFLARADEFRVPTLTGPVMDQAQMLSPSTVDQLGGFLREIKDRGGAQIQVLTVKSLDGLPIEEASIKVTDAWKLGKKKEDRGILILLAASEHRVRIEVGQGLEGDIPDAVASRIVHEIMIPRLRDGSADRAVVDGVSAVLHYSDPKLVEDAEEPKFVQAHHAKRPVNWFMIIFWIVVILIILRPRGGGGGPGGFATGFLLGNLGGGGGFGGGGGSSGGGWSGGGGGFSGGGSSGSW